MNAITNESFYDVIVIGGGNAGLNAAIVAREKGATVLVVESAPRLMRGGNSRHVRNFRCKHDHPLGVLKGHYTSERYIADLISVTKGDTNLELAKMLVERSENCYQWFLDRGVRFQSALRGTLQLSHSNAFFLGGGKALLNTLYDYAKRIGVNFTYDSKVTELDIEELTVSSMAVEINDNMEKFYCGAVVLSSGGFQGNTEWLKEIWGAAANNFIIRGTPYDDGMILKAMIDANAATVGSPKQCHAIAVDARSPKFDGGIVTRVDCITHGIVVNDDAMRFYDEGEDFWPKRYAIWGKLIAEQKNQMAYVIIDHKMIHEFLPTVLPPYQASSITELAKIMRVSSEQLVETIETFNESIHSSNFNHAVLDDCHTQGLTPEKSNWARKINEGPFYAYPLKPGITFTYLGLKVNNKAQALSHDNQPFANIYAAGEIMAGNVLGEGYIAGIGMTIGTVFGQIAGEHCYD
jgi:tricarballylate dehydrogenase